MYFCPQCKAEVPSEALFCPQCGFNATNARLNSLSSVSNEPRPPDRSGVPDTPQPKTPTLHVPPARPKSSTPTSTIQPHVKRVMNPHNGIASPTPPIPQAPMVSSSLPSNAEMLIPTTPPVVEIPTALAPPEGQAYPSIPSRPVPSSSYTRQSDQKQLTPAHLLALQPSIPPTSLTPPASIPPLVQQISPVSPIPAPRNVSQPTPAQPVRLSLQQERLQPPVQQSPIAQQSPIRQQPQERLQPPVQQSPIAQQSPIRQQPQERLQPSIGQPPQERLQPPIGQQRIMPNTTGGDESFVATSHAAEHWRTSWRNRQRSEAGPATSVSRGHSSVPQPLMIMQHSFARIRAITKIQPKKKRISFFWVSIVLMACLIIGTSILIILTYSGNSGASGTPYTAPAIPAPSLSVREAQGATISVGQILHLHGDNFNIGDPIIFLFDGTSSISGTNGREIAIQVSNTGTFDVSFPVATSWTNGPHVIEAEDNHTGQTAYLSIQVGPMAPTSANTMRGLSLSQSHLKFQVYIGQGNPKEQFITLTNTNNVPLTWTAQATTDNGLHWLTVDTTTTSGTMNAGGTANVGVEATTSTLKNNVLPYTDTGNILLSINGQTQLVVPVTLLVQDSAEWVFSPKPVIGVLSAQGGTCTPNNTLSLINLGNVPVFWHILLSSSATSYIQFMINGKPYMQGELAPAGQQGDTQILTLACNNVHIGATYPFTIDANDILWNDSVLIKAS